MIGQEYAMNKTCRNELEKKRKKLKELFQKYEFATADILPPIKVLDGMPYSQTNDVSSMSEIKAIRLVELVEEINGLCDDVIAMLHNIDDVKNEPARYFIQLRYICAFDWKDIKAKTNTDRSTEYIRSVCNYYVNKVL